jgi:hypothetical protein
MRFCPLGWLMRQVNRARKAPSVTLPAPVGGLNTRDALAAMEPIYAADMSNLFPQAGSVDVRTGYSVARSRSSGGIVGTTAFGFVNWANATFFFRYISIADASFINIADGSAQALGTGSLTALPIYTQFTNTGGTYAVVVNNGSAAADRYWTFDGTNWVNQTASLTSSATLSFVHSFRKRLWFLKSSSQSAFYLPTLAIIGTPIEFPLGAFLSKGGNLYAMGTWMRDGGEGGMDDFLCFLSVNGQLVVYQGTDPATNATFALVGVFDLPRPIGIPLKFGADLLIPTEDGLYSMAQVMSGNTTPDTALSNIIRDRWQTYAAANLAGSYPGNTNPGTVSMAYSSKHSVLLVMFNTGDITAQPIGDTKVLAMNTITGAWTDFDNLDGTCIDVWKDDIYFANSTTVNAYVYKYGGSTVDNPLSVATAITASAVQAYTSLGVPGIKVITGMAPSITVSGNTHTMAVKAYADFATNSATAGSNSYAAGSYRTVYHFPISGVYVSVVTTMTTPTTGTNAFRWFSTDLLFMPGGFV